MNQQDYVQAVEEMKTPASKVLEWVNIIINEYYGHYNETNRQNQEYIRDLFDRVTEASHQLVNMIPQIQLELKSKEIESFRVIQIFTHVLSGPIMQIRDYTKIILLYPFWLPEAEQSEDEREHIRYINKINSAAEYLSSLDRDVVLKMMLEKLDD